ncbi:MAG: transposase [Planctomycetes bacterium]|nr:transposase [Planctomycetota bacterium]
MCPATYHPNRQWMMQQVRNVQMWLDDEGIDARFLIRDRDTEFAPAFDALFNDAGIRIVKTPVQAPNANAFAESWIGSLKRKCLDHFVCFSREHLGHILHEYVRFYNRYRPRQGLGNRTLAVVPLAMIHRLPNNPNQIPSVANGSSADCCDTTTALLRDDQSSKHLAFRRPSVSPLSGDSVNMRTVACAR